MKDTGLVVEFDRQKALHSANVLYEAFERASTAIMVFHTTIEHSIESTKKFYEAMDKLDSKTEEGKHGTV